MKTATDTSSSALVAHSTRATGSLSNFWLVVTFSTWAVVLSALGNYVASALSLLLALAVIHIHTGETLVKDALKLATECNDGWKEAIEHCKHLARKIDDMRKANR